MHKRNLRIGNQPGERQKLTHLSKPKAMSSPRKDDSSETQMETSKVSKGKESTVKKCKPRALPEIRHTLASKLRLVKANPLLEVSGAITLPPSVKKSVVVSFTKENLQQIRSEIAAKSLNIAQPKQDKSNKNMVHKTVQQKREPEKIKPNNVLQPVRDSDRNKQQNVARQRLNSKSKPLSTVQQRKISKNKTQTSVQQFSNAQHPKRPVTVKTSLATNKEKADKKILQRTVTFSNLSRKSTVNVRRSRSASDLPSPIREDEDIVDHKVFVKTPIPVKGEPSSAQRQSFVRSNSWRRSMYAPMPKVLRENLERWLKKHGKTVTNFHHLHRFGLKASDITNPSPYSKASESDILNSTFTADDSSISQAVPDKQQSAYNAEGEDKENIKNAKSVVENTLKDLLDLINMGYPQDTCEQWLHLIQKHFYNVREEPMYWECRAALEESSHDMKAAINCYEQAIIKGAQPEEISKSLDGLMEKFKFLHLDPEEKNKLNSRTKATRRHILDARNIFKSSIIKFALQERKYKRESEKADAKDYVKHDSRPTTPGEVRVASSHYVATPVRRSARISSAGYSVTPKLMCVSSLSRLTDGIREQLVFEPNSALEP